MAARSPGPIPSAAAADPQPAGGADMLTPPPVAAAAADAHAELLNERARILGMQLQVQRLQGKVMQSMAADGRLSLEQQVQAQVTSGAVGRRLEEARAQLRTLSAARDRLASSLSASRSASSVSVFGARPPRSRTFAAAALEHVKEWVEQQEAGLSNLEDVLTGQRGLVGCLKLEQEEERDHGPGGPVRQGSSMQGACKAQAHGSGLRPASGCSWPSPVAHFVDHVPVEIMGAINVPSISYPPAPSAAAPPGGWQVVPDVCWDAAPYITDPTGQQWRVARHAGLEQALQLAGDGDVVLLSPGRYSLIQGEGVLRRSIHVIGMGMRQQDVVLYNNQDDDSFMECFADNIVMENLTLLQRGGYDGVVQVLSGRTTLRDCVLQCSMSGAWLRSSGHLVMYNCKVFGASSSAIQIEAGSTRLELYGCEITLCGNGDDIVPRDLGAIDIQVRLLPLSASGLPLLAPILGVEDLRRLCSSPASPSPQHLGSGNGTAEGQCSRRDGEASAAASRKEDDTPSCSRLGSEEGIGPEGEQRGRGRGVGNEGIEGGGGSQAAAGCSAGGHATSGAGGMEGCVQERGGSGGVGKRAAGGAPPPEADAMAALEAALAAAVCRMDEAATVVVGPGCKVHANRGFALSVVKPRALVLYHESLFQSGGALAAAGAAGPKGGAAAAASGAAAGSGGGPPAATTPAVAAALEGVQLYVHGGVQLPGNSRGALGVVDAEYADMDGDEVNMRTSAKHFHSAQLSGRQLKDGFCSRGRDWDDTRRACLKAEAAAGGPAGPGRTPSMKGATSALRTKYRNRNRLGGGGSGPLGSGAGRPGSGSGCSMSALRVMLCRCYVRAARAAAAAEGGGGGGSAPPSSTSSPSSGCSSSDDEAGPARSPTGADAPSDALSAGEFPGQPGEDGAHASGAAQESALAAVPPDKGSEDSGWDGGAPPRVQSRARLCHKCGQQAAKVKKCSRCRQAWYCSQACQREDWKAHKSQCFTFEEQEPHGGTATPDVDVTERCWNPGQEQAGGSS